MPFEKCKIGAGAEATTLAIIENTEGIGGVTFCEAHTPHIIFTIGRSDSFGWLSKVKPVNYEHSTNMVSAGIAYQRGTLIRGEDVVASGNAVVLHHSEARLLCAAYNVDGLTKHQHRENEVKYFLSTVKAMTNAHKDSKITRIIIGGKFGFTFDELDRNKGEFQVSRSGSYYFMWRDIVQQA